jgi:hypothetical protein
MASYGLFLKKILCNQWLIYAGLGWEPNLSSVTRVKDPDKRAATNIGGGKYQTCWYIR